MFHHLLTLCPEVNVWVAFGTGKSFTYCYVNAIYKDLGKDKSLAVPVFHSFTGCDTTSTFFGRGKKSAWEAWNCYKDVMCAFTYLVAHLLMQVRVDEEPFQLLEHFTVLMYDKASEQQYDNSCKKKTFKNVKRKI